MAKPPNSPGDMDHASYFAPSLLLHRPIQIMAPSKFFGQTPPHQSSLPRDPMGPDSEMIWGKIYGRRMDPLDPWVIMMVELWEFWWTLLGRIYDWERWLMVDFLCQKKSFPSIWLGLWLGTHDLGMFDIRGIRFTMKWKMTHTTVDGPAKSDKPPIWDVWNPINNGISHRFQLTGDSDFATIHSTSTLWRTLDDLPSGKLT
jgi:hypothetical protein